MVDGINRLFGINIVSIIISLILVVLFIIVVRYF